MRSSMFIGKIRIFTVYTLTLTKLSFLIFGYGIYVSSVYIRDILLIAMVVRPKWKVFGTYLKLSVMIPDLSPLNVFISDVNISNKEDSCGIIRFPRTVECSIISSERIMKLQSAIIKKLYASWFEIACSNDDLEVLSAYGNTGWLTHNLFLASGIKNKKAVVLSKDNKRKIQTVFRAYVSSLALYLKLEDRIKDSTVDLPELSISAKIGRLFRRTSRNRLITKNIYPKSIEIQSLKIRKENMLSYGFESARQIKINSEYSGFNKYLGAQSLIMEGRIQNRDKTEKLMNKLESLH